MNDDQSASAELEAMQAEHRRLDERIRVLCAESIGDQLEVARLKRRKLRLKDHIQQMIDSSIPDIIA